MKDTQEPHSEGRPLHHAPSVPKRPKGWLIAAGVLAGLLLVFLICVNYARTHQLKVERQQRWLTKAQPRLAKANEACTESIDTSIRVLTDFVAERKTGARPLAEAMLTFGSKWRLVVSHLPSWLGGDSNAHRAFLEQKFSENVFTSEQMRQAVEAAAKTYLDHVQDIENQLLVDIRADLADLPADAIPGISSQEVFAKRFEELVKKITPQLAESLGLDVARELGTWVAGELAPRIAIRVLASVAMRLGVSAGILTAGASASWATFGLSVLAAIVVDKFVGWIINWATDPVGKLEARIKEMLDEICKLVVEGEGETHGMRAELRDLNAAREQVRTEALRKIILGN